MLLENEKQKHKSFFHFGLKAQPIGALFTLSSAQLSCCTRPSGLCRPLQLDGTSQSRLASALLRAPGPNLGLDGNLARPPRLL
jgi:hypothetical protein